MTVQLKAINGNLYYPGAPCRDICAVRPGDDVILLHAYPQGDCDAIRWPQPNRDHLHQTLFNDRERGLIDDEEVLLPDGTSAWR